MNKNKSLIIIIVVLAIIIAGVSFFAVHQMQQNKEMSELFAVEKMEMEKSTAPLLHNTTNSRFRLITTH